MLEQSKKGYVSLLLRSKNKYCIQGSIPLRAREGTQPGIPYFAKDARFFSLVSIFAQQGKDIAKKRGTRDT